MWTLAGRVAAAAAVPVAVLGPPPPVTWIANDKALFGELVELVLGPGWIPETRAATTVPGCVDLLHELAPRCTRVGLKRTRCASGTGNLVLDAAQIRAQAPAATATVVRGFLARTEWRAPEPVLAVAWETATSSPSTQWWIPAATAGEPRLDGVYEQILSGAGQLFVGSRPSTLPAAVNRALADAGRRVAAALQALGYVGRCSFDHLVLGDPHAEFTLRFTECNGRWGGTSTPMHLVDRVVSGPRRATAGRTSCTIGCRGWASGRCSSGWAATPSTPAPRAAATSSTMSARWPSTASSTSSRSARPRPRPSRPCWPICPGCWDCSRGSGGALSAAAADRRE